MEYPNSGSLWPNKNRTNEKAPSMRGSIKMDPALLQELMTQANGGLVEIELAAWTQDYQGSKFLSIKGTVPYKKAAATPVNDDDLPF